MGLLIVLGGKILPCMCGLNQNMPRRYSSSFTSPLHEARRDPWVFPLGLARGRTRGTSIVTIAKKQIRRPNHIHAPHVVHNLAVAGPPHDDPGWPPLSEYRDMAVLFASRSCGDEDVQVLVPQRRPITDISRDQTLRCSSSNWSIITSYVNQTGAIKPTRERAKNLSKSRRPE